MPTFATTGPINASVKVAGAHVHLNATDRPDTVVLLTPLNPSSQKDMKVAENTKIDFFDGELLIKTTAAGDRNGSVAITIDLPVGSGLGADLAYSSLQVDGRLGHCELNMASGRTQLDHVDALHANLAAGEVAITHIDGPVDIRGGSAAVRIGTVTGAVKIVSSTGPVWIGEAAAELNLTNSSGGFDIDRAGGSVTAMTDGGIRIGRMNHGHAQLTNASGDIEVGIGEGTAVRIEADTKFGSVRNSLPVQEVSGTTRLVTIDARSRRGDITVQRSAR